MQISKPLPSRRQRCHSTSDNFSIPLRTSSEAYNSQGATHQARREEAGTAPAALAGVRRVTLKLSPRWLLGRVVSKDGTGPAREASPDKTSGGVADNLRRTPQWRGRFHTTGRRRFFPPFSPLPARKPSLAGLGRLRLSVCDWLRFLASLCRLGRAMKREKLKRRKRCEENCGGR